MSTDMKIERNLISRNIFKGNWKCQRTDVISSSSERSWFCDTTFPTSSREKKPWNLSCFVYQSSVEKRHSFSMNGQSARFSWSPLFRDQFATLFLPLTGQGFLFFFGGEGRGNTCSETELLDAKSSGPEGTQAHFLVRVGD